MPARYNAIIAAKSTETGIVFDLKATLPAVSFPWPRAQTWQRLWREHGLPILLYGLLSVALSWPLIQSFTTQIPGHSNDAHNGLWVMWHVKEAVLGRQPLYGLPLLYYPSGATLLTHVPGPLTGFFALPFWPLGPEAAHNGAVLISFLLTGYFMYLLARGLGFARPIAFFAGTLLLVAPMHLAGLWGHTTKTFFGMMPLTLLALHYTLDLRRSPWWAVATAVALLLTLMHHSFQFIMAGVAIAFFYGVALLRAPRAERRPLLMRGAALAISGALIVGPLFLATIVAGFDPSIDLSRNFDSYTFQPDLLEFLLPSTQNLFVGDWARDVLASYGIAPGIETAVSLSWVALLLCVVALLKAGARARLWLLFTFGWVVLALGPSLRFLGERAFTEYNLPIILPYAFVTGLPGLDFLRTSGRFMQMGYVGLGIAACFGLAWLTQRYPRYATPLAAAAVLLLLLESWPQPWPRMTLRPTPAFYQQIAADEETYGVLDIPFAATEDEAAIVYGTHAQMYQMTHKKGIALGYISRTYDLHPVLPCLIPELLVTADVTANGEPARCYENALYDLARNNYRYVVRHKPQPAYEDFVPGSWGDRQAADIVARLFAGQAPLADDALVTVYAVPPLPDESTLKTSLVLKENWYRPDPDGALTVRWARSPATLWIYAPAAQEAVLEVTPVLIHAPGPDESYLGSQGVLDVVVGDGAATAVATTVATTVAITAEETARIPLSLAPGINVVTLSLQAGNFRPAAYGLPDSRTLSFAIRSMNLEMAPPAAAR